jgi:CRP-like cAMP-binding protein
MAQSEIPQLLRESLTSESSPKADHGLAADLEPLGSRRHAAGGTVLFRQGEAVTGAYLVVSGRVDLRLSAEHSKRIVGRTAGPDAVLGLPATISGEPYSLTATTLEPCELVFLQREDVLTALRSDPARAMALLQTLAHEVHHLREVWPGKPRKTRPRAKRRLS